jgi:hypothetical protein
MHIGFWGVNLKEKDHLEDGDVDVRIILKLIFRNWDRGVDWSVLAHNRNRWKTDVNAVMSLRVP